MRSYGFQVPELPFSIVISSPTETTTTGKPLIIKITVANVADHDVIFPAYSPLENPLNPFHGEGGRGVYALCNSSTVLCVSAPRRYLIAAHLFLSA